MSDAAPGFEGLLHRALSPVDPPADLGRRLQSTLTSITESAAEELEAWELSAMRDPRNWVRPAAAVVVGSGAGVALVLLRARQQARPPGAIRSVLAVPPSARPAMCAISPAGCSATAELGASRRAWRANRATLGARCSGAGPCARRSLTCVLPLRAASDCKQACNRMT